VLNNSLKPLNHVKITTFISRFTRSIFDFLIKSRIATIKVHYSSLILLKFLALTHLYSMIIQSFLALIEFYHFPPNITKIKFQLFLNHFIIICIILVLKLAKTIINLMFRFSITNLNNIVLILTFS
jgi:hypothetical protein